VTLAFSAVPAPLYVLYQARDHFGSFLVTVIFVAYAIGVMASLFLAGHLSDWFGRRRVLLIAVAINMLSGAVFLLWPSVPGLIAGRLMSGISIGMLAATATAALSELHAAARPGSRPARAELVSAVANLGGLGLGPLLAGLLAQYASAPLRLPYLVSEALMLLAAVALSVVPETVAGLETAAGPGHRPRYRSQRVSVPAGHRPLFYAAGLAAAVDFALFGLFTSLAPGFLAGTLHDHSHALAGAVAFVVFGAAALAQIAASRMTLARQFGFGLSAVAAGLVLVVMAVWLPSLPLLLTGGVLAGGGAGAAFRGSIAMVSSIAPPQARGEALAGLFLAAYAGLAVPVLGLGVATELLSTRTAVLGFAVALILVVAAVSRRLLRASASQLPLPAPAPPR
jgi:MFS family permease